MIVKNIIILILAVVCYIKIADAGLPPTSIKGQAGTKDTFFNLEVPNYQNTKLEKGSLIETGNKNILVNPGFEHAQTDTGWTGTSIFGFPNTSTFIEGKQSMELSSDRAATFWQDSTLYASAFTDGVQGLASIRIKTTVSNVQVCSRKAGANDICLPVDNGGKWKHYKIPFTLGATSNGIAVVTQATSVGSIFIDDAFVGMTDLKQDVNAITDWKAYTPVINSNTSVIANQSRWRRVGDVMEIVGFVQYNGTGSAGQFFITLPSGYSIDTNKIQQVGLGQNYGTWGWYNAANAIGSHGGYAYYRDTTTIALLRSDVSDSVDSSIFATGDRVTWYLKVPIVGWSSGNTISSGQEYSDVAAKMYKAVTQTGLAGNTDTKVSFSSTYDTAAKWDAANNWYTIPEDGRYRMYAKVFISGTSPFAGAQYVRARIVASNGTTEEGYNYPNAPDGIPQVSTTMNLKKGDTVHVTGGSNVGYNLTGVGGPISSIFTIEKIFSPQVITGSFEGIEKCAINATTGISECDDTFSAKVSATRVVSNESSDFINGDCAVWGGTGNSRCYFRTGIFTVAPNCTATSGDLGTGRMCHVDSNSEGVNVFCQNSTQYMDSSFTLSCQKTGADYRPKMAKIADPAAIENMVKTPGQWKPILFGVSFGGASGYRAGSNCTSSPCSMENNFGGIITTVTRQGQGSYDVHVDVSKVAASDYNCSCGTVQWGVAGTFCRVYVSGTSFRVDTMSNPTTYNDSAGMVVCHGKGK